MLQRMRCDFEVKFAADAAKEGTFSGYGSVFSVTDQGGDMIVPGAFKESLNAWAMKGKLPKMFLMHGGGLFGGAEDALPIGKYTAMQEDSKGLHVQGELFALDTPKGRLIHEGLKSGELDGLSIGYRVDPQDIIRGQKTGEPRRTLKKVNVREVSIVTYGMNQEALVDSAKSIELIKSLADAEDYLRDACGFSRSQAVAFVSRIKGLRPSDSEGQDEVQQHLKQALSTYHRGLSR